MIRYLAHRVFQGVIVLLLVATVVFIISRLSGNPVNQMLPENATEAQREALTHQLGLDEPLVVQYWVFLSNATRGEFGMSHRFRMPAMELVLSRLGDTLLLAASGMLIALIVGVTIGVVSALRQQRLVDHVLGLVLTVFQSVPAFWVGILLILVFGVTFRALPFTGNQGFESLILPAVTLSIVPTVSIARVTRTSVIDTLSRDYIITARAKGLRSRAVVSRHVLRNSFIPVLTITGLMSAEAIGGAVITEQLFAWPGIGSLAVEAINVRDYAVLQAVTIVVAFFVVAVSLTVDLLYRLVDPRVQLERSAA